MATTVQSPTLSAYLQTVKRTLEGLFSIELVDSQVVERQMRPEFYSYLDGEPNREMYSIPIVIARNNHEKIKIEHAVNAMRISIALKKSDELEKWIYSSFSEFIHKRSFTFIILCKKPQPDYDFTFLINAENIDRLLPYKIIDFILFFIQEVDKNMNNLKLQVNARLRNNAEDFLTKFY